MNDEENWREKITTTRRAGRSPEWVRWAEKDYSLTATSAIATNFSAEQSAAQDRKAYEDLSKTLDDAKYLWKTMIRHYRSVGWLPQPKYFGGPRMYFKILKSAKYRPTELEGWTGDIDHAKKQRQEERRLD